MITTIHNTNIGVVGYKIPGSSSLVTATVFNIKIGEVENKIPDHGKYITTPKFNRFTGPIFDAKSKQANLATNSNVNTVEQHASKNYEKIEKLETFDFFI